MFQAMASNTPLTFPPQTLWLIEGFLSHTSIAGKKGEKQPGHAIKKAFSPSLLKNNGVNTATSFFYLQKQQIPFFPKAPPVWAQFHLLPTPSRSPPHLGSVSCQRYFIYIEKNSSHSSVRNIPFPDPAGSGAANDAIPLQVSRLALATEPRAALSLLPDSLWLPNYALVWLICEYSHISSACFQASSPQAPGGVTGASSNE